MIREEEEAQEGQETGPEGVRILGERGEEVQGLVREMREALHRRDPGQLEKRRGQDGKWVTAGEEAASEVEDPPVEGRG